MCQHKTPRGRDKVSLFDEVGGDEPPETRSGRPEGPIEDKPVKRAVLRFSTNVCIEYPSAHFKNVFNDAVTFAISKANQYSCCGRGGRGVQHLATA